MKNDVSVGMFCKNSIHNLANWLSGIRAQTRQPDRIFAIDGLSTDGTVEFLKRNKVEVFSEKDNSPQEAFFKMLKKTPAIYLFVPWLTSRCFPTQ